MMVGINMQKTVQIGRYKVGKGEPPFVIAEMSGNHNQSLERALLIVEEVAKAGAHALKLQTYTADTMTLNLNSDDFTIRDKNSLWDGESLYDLYDKAHTPWKWHKEIFAKANSLGLVAFSSPFDTTAVDFLEKINVPCYKIASFEMVDLPLIKYVAQTGKPIIMSTGMGSAEEIQEAIDAAKEGGCEALVLLHCVSGYPAPTEDYNLSTLQDMQARFSLPVGLSDHTISNITAITSVALGACAVEKHVTLDREGGGVDDSFSLEPIELKSLCLDLKEAWGAIGHASYIKKASEINNAKFRRSLYAVRNIDAGELITKENVKSIRPGFGLPVKDYEKIIGQKAKVNISKGTALEYKFLGE